MTRQVLVLSTTAVFGLCLLLVGLVTGTKVGRTLRRAHRTELLAPYRADLIAVSAGEDDHGHASTALTAADGSAREIVDQAAIGMLGKIRGLPADQLIEVLEAHGAVERARGRLGRGSALQRAQAAQVLGLSHDAAAVRALVEALQDGAVEVRTSAAYALGRIADEASAAPLLKAVGAAGAGLPAGIAADALLNMGTGISSALVDALADPEARTRHVAAYVSGVGAFLRSVPELHRRLEADDDLTVREASAMALGAIGGPGELGVLTRHTGPEHPLPLRRVCAAALGDLGDPGAVPALAGLLEDPDPRLAEHAAAAMLRLGTKGREALMAGERPASADGPVAAALAIARLQGAVP